MGAGVVGVGPAAGVVGVAPVGGMMMNGGMGGMYMNNDNFENMYDNMNNMEFEEPEFEMEDGMGYGMGAMGMGAMGMGGVANMGMNGMAMTGAGMGMNGMAMTGANMGMSGAAMGMGAGMGASSVAQTVVPVTGVRYKLKPYTYKYTYPVWKPDTKMAFTQTPYNNPCASGCNSRNPHCCHKEVTYVPKTVPKVVEETVSVPVEVDVPNVSCGCHASRPHCCGSRRPVSSSSSGCSCHASAPHCCRLSSPKWAYERPSRNQHYGAVGYPF